jgi:hypothetical protein
MSKWILQTDCVDRWRFFRYACLLLALAGVGYLMTR